MARETREERQKRLENERVLRQRQQKERRQESFIFGSLLNTTTYMVIFLLLIFGLSAEAYQREPQRYSWLDENGEFKTSTYDVEVSYNLDTPLNEFNNQSLNDVFLDGNLIPNHDFSNSSTSFYTNYNGGIYDHSSGVLIGIGNGTSTRAFVFIDGLTNLIDTFYLSSEIKTSIFTQNVYTRSYAQPLTTPYLYGVNDWQRYSDLRVPGNTRFFLTDFRGPLLNTYDTVYIDNIYLINLSDLGISNLTKAEMDYWFSEYQRLQENRINDMKNLGQYAVSSWTTTTEILKSVGEALNSVYETMPVSWLLDWILDISL